MASSSTGALVATGSLQPQYVTLQKLFSGASSVILLFSNPAPKTKTGTVNKRETINRKACGRIIMIGQSKQVAPARSDQIYYTV
jgi:hypothetical protein